MENSLLGLADNLVEGLHKTKCKYCKSCLEYFTVDDSFLVLKCVGLSKL